MDVQSQRCDAGWGRLRRRQDFISHKMSVKSFCKSQFPHKFVILFFILVIMKDTLTNLSGNEVLRNDNINYLCEMKVHTLARKVRLFRKL